MKGWSRRRHQKKKKNPKQISPHSEIKNSRYDAASSSSQICMYSCTVIPSQRSLAPWEAAAAAAAAAAVRLVAPSIFNQASHFLHNLQRSTWLQCADASYSHPHTNRLAIIRVSAAPSLTHATSFLRLFGRWYGGDGEVLYGSYQSVGVYKSTSVLAWGVCENTFLAGCVVLISSLWFPPIKASPPPDGLQTSK